MVAPRKSLAVVLSDIHIGNGARTCWYQPAVHDQYLSAALQWAAGNPAVREVVLLGDVFDVWTYPPWATPPTMREIIDANPVLLGKSGPFAALVKALPSHVSLMLGNHDGTLTHGDVDTLNASLGGDIWNGEAIRLIDDPVLVLGTAGARVALSHGHHWCMFNAPDEKGPWHGLPLGHVVSRAIAYQLEKKKLSGSQTAADLPGMGNPAGVELRGLFGSFPELASLLAGSNDDIATPVVNYVCRATGMPETEPIVLPGGQRTTAREAKAAFKYLFRHWTTVKEGRRLDAERAALADQDGVYLAWFAQRLAMRRSADLVVLGHTHRALRCLGRSPVNYVNSGYECVSKPDLKTQDYTFTVVDLDHATAQLHKVVAGPGGATVMPAAEPELESPIVRPARDFSCYLRIVNRSGRPLTLDGRPTDNGSFWAVPPPKAIADGERADIWLQDQLFGRGAAGAVAYSDGVSAKPLTFRFSCPVTSDNSVSSSVDSYETRVGGGDWRARGPDTKGFPLQMRLTVDAARYAGRNGHGPAAPHVSAVAPAAPVPGRGLVASKHADYLALARAILSACRYPAYRGKVLTYAHLRSADLQPLLDTTTEPSGRRGGVRLVRAPQHVLGPDVYRFRLDPYGTFDFVLIQPTGAAPPVFGGFLFLPGPGSPNLDLVTFNVAKLDVSWNEQCRNNHHAELQVTTWVEKQPASWRARIGCLTLTNGSRDKRLAYSPCNSCCDDLAHFLDNLNRPRPAAAKVAAAISWGNLYDKGARCGHPTTKSGVEMLTKSGWKIPLDPLPLGMHPTPDTIARPGQSGCLDQLLSTR